MNRAVARGVVLATTFAAVALFAASSISAASSPRVDCHTGNVVFLFRGMPGHNAVPSVGFPAFPFPHMEVYNYANGRYPNANEIGIVEFQANGTTGAGFAKSCTAVAGSGAVDASGAAGKTTTPNALLCAFPVPVDFDSAKTSSSITLRALIPTAARPRLGAAATFTSAGATLQYDKVFCKTTPLPH